MTLSTDSILQLGLLLAAAFFVFNIWQSYRTGETFSGFILVFREKQPRMFFALILFNAALAVLSLATMVLWVLHIPR